MLKNARAGKSVNLDDMPPPVAIKEAPPTQSKPHPPPPAAPTKPAPKPAPKGPPPSNLIDLDDPEFAEFDLSEEDIANMAMSFVDDRQQQQPQAHSGSGIGTQQSQSGSSVVVESHSGSSASVSHSSSRVAPPQPKPRSPPKPTPREVVKPRPQLHPPPMGPGGRIDLDDPMFDEFTLSDEDIAAMAAAMTDDRQTKKPRIDDTAAATGKPAESAHSSSQQQQQQQTAPIPRVRTAPPPPQPAVPATRSLPANLKGTDVSRGVADKASLPALLTERRQQYQEAAGKQKNPAKQKEYKVIAAKFVRVQKAVESGQEVDLSQMPGPPPGYKSSYNIDLSKFSTPTPPPPAAPTQTPKPAAPPTQGQSSAAEEEEPDAPPNQDIPTPKTALEALEQRVAKYREGLKTAQDKGESSRVRRMGRIIKQYETAIKATKAGKPCDYEELPTPPGYPPIPQTRRPTVPMPTQSLPVHTMSTSAAGKSLTPSISRQQVLFVERRISELRQAAKMEQGKGNRDTAIEYMRKVKGLNNMLVAAQGGVPVNLEQVPPSPFASLDTTKPSGEVMSHLRPAEEKDKATFELIIKQLQKQVEICDRNSDTYKKMGSDGSAIEYENMSQNCQRELLALKGIQSGGFGPPKFSLETRTMTIIHSNMHLNGGVCEVEVAKVTDLTRPPKYDEKDMDVYVEVGCCLILTVSTIGVC